MFKAQKKTSKILILFLSLCQRAVFEFKKERKKKKETNTSINPCAPLEKGQPPLKHEQKGQQEAHLMRRGTSK